MRAPRIRLALVAILALGASAATRERADAGDEAKPSGNERRCVLTGRVVDGWRSGVAGVKVGWIGNSPAGDRSTAAAVRTDVAGRFRLELDGLPSNEVRGTIHTTRGDDAAALAMVVLGAGDREKDVGSLALRPARPLHVDVRRGTAPGARVWLWLNGYLPHRLTAFIGTAMTDANGRAEFSALPAATMRLFVRATDGSVGEEIEDVVPGSAPSRVSVELTGTRAVDVLVTSDDSPALPIGGATVFRRFRVSTGCIVESVAAQVPNWIAPTTADGHTRVDGLPLDGYVELEARIPGRPWGSVGCKPGETTATIVILKPTAIPVKDSERPRPPNGTKIVVHGRRTGAAGVEGSMESGAIVVPLLDHEISPGLAIAPDGSLAPLERAQPTSFFRPRSLVVRIVEKDGRGVAGARVSLASSPYVPGPWETPIRTDAEGRVRFDGLAPVKHFVEILAAAEDQDYRIGEVDLASGDTTREVLLGAEGTLLVHVTIEGRPAIPEWFGWTISKGIVSESAIDRATGTVRIRARSEDGASGPGSIQFEGRGVRPRTVLFPWPARGETTSIEAPLVASPEVVTDVRADPDSEVHVHVERWESSPWSTKPWGRGQWYSHGGPYQAGRMSTELPEGRYRLRDRETGVISEAFDVPDRGPNVVATLDLTGLVTVRGRVECPDPADAEGVELVIDGEGIDSQWPRIPSGRSHGMSYDGKSFALRIPAGRRVTISPWHWKLQPARKGGEVTLVGPRDDVVLKMGAGATLIARLTDPDGRPLSADELQHAWITAVPAAHPSWEPEIGTMTSVAGKTGTVSASGLPFGTLDVWIQTEGFAARRMERATVASDITDLGEVRLSRGSKVLLRRVREDGAVAPVGRPIDGWAFATFGPRQIRDLGHIRDEFTGLCAGRWRIEVWPSGTEHGQDREERALEVDVDGEHDQTLNMDADGRPVPTPK